ncbi:MAG: hypothetical protein QM758_05710 [Armatimonas sp.]
MPAPELVAANMTLTQKQNARWQEMIVGDGTKSYEDRWHALRTMAALLPEPAEFLRESMKESEARLAGLGAPGWAFELRTLCAIETWSGGVMESGWLPRFALRSETALVGIQLATSNDEELQTIYQHIFIRFVARTLRPFVDDARQVNAYNKEGYRPMMELYLHCERFLRSAAPYEWPEAWSLFHRGNLNKQDMAAVDAFDTGREFLREIRAVMLMTKGLDSEGTTPWNISRSRALLGILMRLNRMHQRRLDGNASGTHGDGPNYTHLIADTYLTTLETECPHPDWLPR